MEGATGLVMRHARPRVALREHVTRLTAYAEPGRPRVRRREVAGAGAVVILGLGDALDVVAGHGAADRLSSFAGGLFRTYTDVVTTGWSEGVQVDLTPLGARMLFGVPMGEVADRVVPVEDLLGGWAGEALDRLAATTDWTERLRVADAMLARRILAAPPPDPRLRRAWRLLVDSHGTQAIGPLAGELGWSHRHLVARFRDQFGHGPKSVARILRFQHAYRRLGTAPLAELAVACGYYDQAHLTRDFRTLAGAPPGALLTARTHTPGSASGSAGRSAGRGARG